LDAGCSELLYQIKQAKFQWLEDQSKINGDSHFRNKKREYLKDKIDELATNTMNKNIRDLDRGINYYKWGHQPKVT
jgi:hypothetical protein